MSEPIEPLANDLASVFAAEKASHRPDPFVRDHVLRRVELAATVAARAGAGAAAGAAIAHASSRVAAQWATWKVGALGLALVGSAFGAGFVVGRTSSPASMVAAPSAAQALPSAPVTLVPTPVLPSVPVAAPTTAPAASTARIASPSTSSSLATSSASSLGAEQSLIDQARAALAKSVPADALRALSRHASAFPHGLLAEERDALVVQALAVSGNAVDARAKAKQFHARYPSSIFGQAVDQSVTSVNEISSERK